MHEGTRFALYDYSLNGQGIEIISAYSAEEGRELMRAHPDIAVVLLDVVMETDDAGLRLVDYIRTELKNETVRIILRTGQPGQAPERRVIVDYDINDYKAKTELTADKLFTALTAALRGYQQLQRMVETRRGLEMIIEGASTLFDFKSMQRLAEGVLTQLAIADQRRVRRHPGAARQRQRAGEVLHPRRLRLLSPLCRPGRLGGAGSRSCAMRSTTPSSGASTNSIPSCRCCTSGPRADAKSSCCWKPAAAVRAPTARWSRCSAAGCRSRSTTSFSTSSCNDATVRLEERVRDRTRALTSANHRLTSQWIRLRRANEFKNEVLGTIAHDLKNPLAVILGRAEMLNELARNGPAAARQDPGAARPHPQLRHAS